MQFQAHWWYDWRHPWYAARWRPPAELSYASYQEQTNWELLMEILVGIILMALIIALQGIKVALDNKKKALSIAKPLLICTAGPLARHEYPLPSKAVYIGTDPKMATIILPAGTKGVSKRHLQIAVKQDEVQIRDCHSSAGTFVAGRKLKPDTWVKVRPGQAITLGGADVAFTIR